MATPSESSDELRAGESDIWITTVQSSIAQLQHEYEEAHTQTSAAIEQIKSDQNQMHIKLNEAITQFGIIESTCTLTENKTIQIARELKKHRGESQNTRRAI